MGQVRSFEVLRAEGRLRWNGDEQAWTAEPDEVLAALAREGFEEYKREVARSGRDRRPAGGLWQGLNSRTGAVASAVWVRTAVQRDAMLFIEIDGEPVRA